MDKIGQRCNEVVPAPLATRVHVVANENSRNSLGCKAVSACTGIRLRLKIDNLAESNALTLERVTVPKFMGGETPLSMSPLLPQEDLLAFVRSGVAQEAPRFASVSPPERGVESSLMQ